MKSYKIPDTMTDQRLPHFVIIGAMKSATTSLQEQLEQQPGIFMCDPKEPNFFSDDLEFHRGIAYYRSLFSSAPADALLGEASTHYTKLPTYPDTISRMREEIPNARLVYVMRHPVDRLVSHYTHEWSLGNLDCNIDDAIRLHPEMTAYGQYARQLDPYIATYGKHAILPVFFDRLIREPQAELERVCRHIGYPLQPNWITNLKPANVSSERIRKFPLYSLLIDSVPAERLRRALIPKTFRNWVKARLTMRQRPVLSSTVLSSLQAEFDHDLERLGSWLGQSLNCRNFKEVTASRPLDWIATTHG